MNGPRPLPDIPGTVTLDQAKSIVGAFGYELAIRPAAPKPAVRVGFADDNDTTGGAS